LKIGIDAIFYGELAGGYKHLSNLLKRWKNDFPEKHFVVYVHKTIAPAFGEYISQNIQIKVVPLVHFSPILGIIWSTLFLPLIVRFSKFNRLFLPFNSFILMPNWYGCITISVIRDLAEYEIENKYDLFRMMYRKKLMMPLTIKYADRLIFISKSTHKDAVKHLDYDKKNFSIIYHGKSGVFHTEFHDSGLLSKLCVVQENYFLTVGRLDPIGKNLIRLLKAFELFLNYTKVWDFKLVLVGSPWRNTNKLSEFLKSYKYNKNVVLTGYLSKKHLIQLYSQAMAFVFPTIYEGFGHPVIEAMSSGCPVICSNVSSLPEIAANSALLFDPYEINEIYSSMNQIYSDKELRTKMVNSGYENIARFSWEKTAERTINYIIED